MSKKNNVIEMRKRTVTDEKTGETTTVAEPKPVKIDAAKTPMDMGLYQQLAMRTAIYPGKKTLTGLTYTILGLAGESGELANAMKKVMRGDPVTQEDLILELSDCLWYIAAVCTELNVPMSQVAWMNLSKLLKRQQTGTIQGNGDHREDEASPSSESEQPPAPESPVDTPATEAPSGSTSDAALPPV